jgi:hypothetical protein
MLRKILFRIKIILQTDGKLLSEPANFTIYMKIQSEKFVYLESLSQGLLWNLKFLKGEKLALIIAEAKNEVVTAVTLKALCCEMWHRVVWWKFTDVSKERWQIYTDYMVPRPESWCSL